MRLKPQITGDHSMCNCCAEKKDIYLPQPATINKTRIMTETEMYFHVTVEGGVFDYWPGQFVEVSIAGAGEAPISISSSPTDGNGMELVVRRVGNVTNAMHKLRPKDKIGIRGPCGKGYPIEQTKGRSPVFICGGIGLAPQRSFIKYCLDNRADYGDITILLGTKLYDQRFFVDELQQLKERKDITMLETLDLPDDRWDGNVGVVTTLIPKIDVDDKTDVFVCGPPIMYKFVLLGLAELKIPKENIYLNLERKMKCGVGKCGHCQINKNYVCMDGPVFRYSELNDAPEAI